MYLYCSHKSLFFRIFRRVHAQFELFNHLRLLFLYVVVEIFGYVLLRAFEVTVISLNTTHISIPIRIHKVVFDTPAATDSALFLNDVLTVGSKLRIII